MINGGRREFRETIGEQEVLIGTEFVLEADNSGDPTSTSGFGAWVTLIQPRLAATVRVTDPSGRPVLSASHEEAREVGLESAREMTSES